MTPLIIGPAQQALIDALIAEAWARRLSLSLMRRLAKAQAEGRMTEALRGRNTPQTIQIPTTYQCTFTIEEHAPGVFCRHLSVSIEARGRAPSTTALALIMEAFHFKNRLGSLAVWSEQLGGDRVAINVLEPLDGDMDQLRDKTDPLQSTVGPGAT